MDLHKTYPKGAVQAVCSNTFGIPSGEVLGLLGPNGAGKSTTFSMVSMQTSITAGSAQLMGTEVNEIDEDSVGMYIGQCNQDNVMWDFLTVDESLNLLARIKGLTHRQREHSKRIIMDTLELTYFKDTVATNLSGGNKRKLCCAMSLIMCPRVEFLDEPTTGVDPVSRRALVRMVKKMKKSSVLLTTHRMDEAEQLCDKIAIMINGKFVVYGTPSYLKTRYGQGYSITVCQARDKFFHA